MIESNEFPCRILWMKTFGSAWIIVNLTLSFSLKLFIELLVKIYTINNFSFEFFVWWMKNKCAGEIVESFNRFLFSSHHIIMRFYESKPMLNRFWYGLPELLNFKLKSRTDQNEKKKRIQKKNTHTKQKEYLFQVVTMFVLLAHIIPITKFMCFHTFFYSVPQTKNSFIRSLGTMRSLIVWSYHMKKVKTFWKGRMIWMMSYFSRILINCKRFFFFLSHFFFHSMVSSRWKHYLQSVCWSQKRINDKYLLFGHCSYYWAYYTDRWSFHCGSNYIFFFRRIFICWTSRIKKFVTAGDDLQFPHPITWTLFKYWIASCFVRFLWILLVFPNCWSI